MEIDKKISKEIEVPITNVNEQEIINYNDPLFGEFNKFYTKKNLYKGVKSNNQIAQIVNLGDIGGYTRLAKLIGKKITAKGKLKFKILHDLLSSETDSYIYNKLKIYFDRDEDIRSTYQAKELYRTFYNSVMCGKNNINLTGKIKSFIDIGCGNGFITQEFKRLIGAEKAYGSEIEEMKSESIEKSKDIEYFYNKSNSNEYKIGLPNGKLSLVTAFMSLHHMENLESMINEIYRILETGGYLFIKEHDCWSAIDAMLIDIEHVMFITCIENKDIMNYNYFCRYINRYGWNKLLEKKFKLIDSDYYYTSIRKEISPTIAFYAIYQKI